MLLLYLHGFNSSPQSHKAQVTQRWLAAHHPDVEFVCPQLSNYPLQVLEQLESIIASNKGKLALAGSSMGGYFATYFAEKYQLRAVLVNPAVRPYLGMHQYLGENINYHSGQRWIMEQKHIEQFQQLDVEQLQRPENIWTLLQTGDEVLDYRHAEQKYANGKVTVERGGDHSFQGYERFLPEIYEFLK